MENNNRWAGVMQNGVKHIYGHHPDIDHFLTTALITRKVLYLFYVPKHVIDTNTHTEYIAVFLQQRTDLQRTHPPPPPPPPAMTLPITHSQRKSFN